MRGDDRTGQPPAPTTASLSVLVDCLPWAAVVSVQLARCEDTSWGGNTLDRTLAGGEGVRYRELDPGCWEVWAAFAEGDEKGNRIQLAAGDEVLFGMCSTPRPRPGVTATRALSEAYRSPTKHAGLRFVNRCRAHYCHVLLSECGQNSWDEVRLPSFSIETNAVVVVDTLPVGCFDFRFVPCWAERYATLEGLGWTLEGGTMDDVMLCGD